jgi:hypothetical protein
MANKCLTRLSISFVRRIVGKDLSTLLNGITQHSLLQSVDIVVLTDSPSSPSPSQQSMAVAEALTLKGNTSIESFRLAIGSEPCDPILWANNVAPILEFNRLRPLLKRMSGKHRQPQLLQALENGRNNIHILYWLVKNNAGSLLFG